MFTSNFLTGIVIKEFLHRFESKPIVLHYVFVMNHFLSLNMRQCMQMNETVNGTI